MLLLVLIQNQLLAYLMTRKRWIFFIIWNSHRWQFNYNQSQKALRPLLAVANHGIPSWLMVGCVWVTFMDQWSQEQRRQPFLANKEFLTAAVIPPRDRRHTIFGDMYSRPGQKSSKHPINSFSPELPSQPLDEKVILDHIWRSLSKLRAEGVYP